MRLIASQVSLTQPQQVDVTCISIVKLANGCTKIYLYWDSLSCRKISGSEHRHLSSGLPESA